MRKSTERQARENEVEFEENEKDPWKSKIRTEVIKT